ncbi:unnamed protein product [Enterobius vermicularis]|uniref:ANK_REP_REGION domain-containing protein n=1 Tax=Enterobius vermicularis TaxID=51028 RepID=A0A0N4VJI4_ENTVE|nr:unnamed protein product [Enterobius vermicularis]
MGSELRYIFEHVKKGDTSRAYEVLSHGSREKIRSRVHAEDAEKETILHHACRSGDIKLMAYLIKHGADVNAENYKQT